MKILNRKSFNVLVFIVIPLLMLGCSTQKEKESNVAEDIKLNLGTVLKSEEGTYKLYNYKDGKYEWIKSNNVILSYDKDSSNYTCIENSKLYVVNKGNKVEITNLDYKELKLSKGGEYVSYFIEDNGLKLKIFDTSKNEQVEIKSNVSISGTLYDWYDANTLVYYGVSDDGVNGVFTYDIRENKEELLYKIKEGYLAYVKNTSNNIVFLQITLENKKKLMVIDKKTKDVKYLTDNIEEISDIVVDQEKVYFTGKVFDNVNSLYELKNNKVKRLVYDFPSIVKIKKGLKADENGNVLFIGSNVGKTDLEQIYMYAKDGSVSLAAKDSIDYEFIDYID